MVTPAIALEATVSIIRLSRDIHPNKLHDIRACGSYIYAYEAVHWEADTFDVKD